MTEQYELIFLKKLQDCIDGLDDLDEIISTNSERQSVTDYELSDWLHFLQNEENIDDETILNVSNKIIALRKKRQSLRNEYECIKRYKELSNRMMTPASRESIKTEIGKTLSNLNQPYKNRVITEDDITFVKAKCEKKTVRKLRRKDSAELDKQLLELKKQGLSQREMAEIVGITQASISVRFKKMKEKGNYEI